MAEGVGAFRSGGRLALDLTWTLRYRAVLPTELLVEPDDLWRWLQVVGLPAPASCTTRQLGQARELREAVYRCAEAVIDGGTIAPHDRDVVNRWAAQPSPAPMLRADGERVLGAPAGREVAAALSAVARDAVALLAARDGRLRRCAGPSCSLLFHDDSRPGSRRWCDTSRCGNRVNTTAYRRRRRAGDPGAVPEREPLSPRGR